MATDQSQVCQSCIHWDKSSMRHGTNVIHRQCYCQKIGEDCEHDDPGLSEKDTAHLEGHTPVSLYFYTGPLFGCIHWEQAP